MLVVFVEEDLRQHEVHQVRCLLCKMGFGLFNKETGIEFINGVL